MQWAVGPLAPAPPPTVSTNSSSRGRSSFIEPFQFVCLFAPRARFGDLNYLPPNPFLMLLLFSLE